LAIKMGREQDVVAAKQMTIMESQRALLQELGTIEKKQADIAETQHRIVLEQRARRARLRVDTGNQSKGRRTKQVTMAGGPGPIAVPLLVSNEGGRTAEGCTWELRIPLQLHSFVRVYDLSGRQHEPQPAETFEVVTDSYDKRVLPAGREEICVLEVESEVERTGEFSVGWTIRHDDGIEPGPGEAWISFKRKPDGFYRITLAQSA
jgi:hypothetical protein